MEKYFLLSKDIGDGPYLLGELVRLSKGETDKYPLGNSHQNFYFYKEIPKRVNRYD
ncbi:MAG: hypothetical protein FWH48_11735 [Oscillospiraceae bacterium]|nr:hypothetical protein [Oscillospiraceae bacterium]